MRVESIPALMMRAEAIPVLIRQRGIPSGVLWGAVAIAAYLLAYFLSQNSVSTNFGDFPGAWEAPIREPIDSAFEWIGDTFQWFFGPIADVIDQGLEWLEAFLLWLPWIAVVGATTLLGLRLGGRGLALLCGASLTFIGLIGFWESAMITLSIMSVSVLIAVAIGIPVGILVAYNDRLEKIVRPILDTMQVLPPFVYLIPALILFGVSGTQSVFLTVIYALPPAIRLTNLGIRQVPREAIETALSHGSTTLQTLFQVQLPLGRPSIMMGVNQTIMMAIAVVIITALVGAGGLGKDVWNALRQIDSGRGLESGVAIVLLAIILDRLSYALARDNIKATSGNTVTASTGSLDSTRPSGPIGEIFGPILTRFRLQIGTAAVIASLAIISALVGGGREFPQGWTFSVADYINGAVDWVAVNLHFISSWIRDNLFRELGFSPIQTLLLWLPWPAVIILSAALACKTAGRGTAVLAVLGLLFVGIGGVWDLTMHTLSQVLTAGVITVAVGICIGVLASQSKTFEAILRPILDTMQTMPIFVYMIPVIKLWDIGPLIGIIATVVYALPPVIRMTSLGINQVSHDVIETAQSHGSTRLQTLTQVQLPLALPTIMMGVNQTVIMVLAMVIIAGLVGGGGLGAEVYVSSIYLRMGDGFIAGMAIVLMAMVLDRMTQGKRGRVRFFTFGR